MGRGIRIVVLAGAVILAVPPAVLADGGDDAAAPSVLERAERIGEARLERQRAGRGRQGVHEADRSADTLRARIILGDEKRTGGAPRASDGSARQTASRITGGVR